MPRNSSYTVFLRSAIPLLMLVSSVGRLDGQQMTTKRTLRIDAAAEGLTEIGSLVVGRDGVIMITQPQDFRVLVFDRAGRRVASIGRKGGGPGEFQAIRGVGRFGDGFWVEDPVLRRFTIVGANFGVSRIVPYPILAVPQDGTRGWAQTMPMALRPDGSVIFTGRLQGEGTLPSWHPQLPVEGAYIFRVSATGAFLELLARHATPVCHTQITETRKATIPFCSEPLTAYSPDGSLSLVVDFGMQAGRDKRYSMRIVGAGRRAPAEAFISFEPLAIPPSIADSALRARAALLRIDPGEFLRRMKAPSYYAPVVAAIVANDGSAWLEETRVGREHRWVARDPLGKVTRRVTLPGNARLVAVESGVLWAVEMDGDGLEHVVTFRVDR